MKQISQDAGIGVLLLVINQVIFGITPNAIKEVNPSFPSSLFVLFRFVISSFVFLIIIVSKKDLKRQMLSLNRGQWKGLILLGVLASGLASYLWIISIRFAGVSIVSAITRLEIPLAILMSLFILKESLSSKFIWTGLISFIGLNLTLFSSDIFSIGNNSIWGVMAAGIIAIIWAFATILGKILLNHHDISPVITTFVRNIFGGLFNLIVALVTLDTFVDHFLILNFKDWLMILFVAICHSTFAFYLYYAALKRISVQKFSLLLMIEPIITVSLGILRGEQLTQLQMIGIGLIFISGYFFTNGEVRLLQWFSHLWKRIRY